MIKTKYDRRTGMILGHVIGVDPSLLPSNEAVIDGEFDPNTHRIRYRQPVPLDIMPLAIEGRKVSGLPKGSTIQFQDQRIKASGEWTAPGLGADLVVITCPGYRPETLRLAAYDARRADEYPTVGEQLDAIWKTLAAIKTLPTEARDILARIKAVKAKHPKG